MPSSLADPESRLNGIWDVGSVINFPSYTPSAKGDFLDNLISFTHSTILNTEKSVSLSLSDEQT